jgi:cobaltochelatase CobT
MALEGVKNIRSDVTYFPGNQNEFEIVSQHGDNIRQKAAYFDQKPKGCTPLSQSLMHAIEKFPKCDKLQRNIIIVVTDGEPDNPTSAKSIMEKAMESGVEIYAIRIGGVATLCNIFKNYEIINDAEELPNSMCTLLENALFNRKNIPV